MLTQSTGGSRPGGEKEDRSLGTEEPEDPVNYSFFEALFNSLREALQSIKKDQSTDHREDGKLHHLWYLREACEVLGITQYVEGETPMKLHSQGPMKLHCKKKSMRSLAELCLDLAAMTLKREAVLDMLSGDPECKASP
ncbi:hypothetical protein NDU88_002563 [Pleurodeles waltl]|uniref:Uncharacterized protein n=1 Tax=Pleurodeles waltl TaxID=8319 RepID=A0AAV7M4A2_PLEWA|nr:hypothetical protein NDU88_002563 [Pleurodeles waltl]